ncbi:MAG: enoyl-CoA hydratase [Acidobacteria bacterium]|nr:MAG: enoyl-CoA hydratase [Acidobacteriota bacterium]REK05900.1 MAG: enoyl-CoA hydratase [Acidobacteriota bacterium]
MSATPDEIQAGEAAGRHDESRPQPAYQELIYEVEDPVATVTLNRPERLNALTGRLLSEIGHAFERAENDQRVVGIVLTGAGRGFSAGADMENLSSAAEGGGDGAGRALPELLASSPGDPEMGPDFDVTYGYFLKLRKPILAAINGPCAGLGFVLAMLSDLRFVSDRAVFTTAFANRGLVAEHGVSWILPRLIGPSKALDILWSGRRFDALEADRLGLVNRLVPHDELLPAARAYIRELAERSSPTSLRLMKQQVYKHLMERLGPSMVESNEMMARSLQAEDFREGVRSYLEKRSPRFPRVGSE